MSKFTIFYLVFIVVTTFLIILIDKYWNDNFNYKKDLTAGGLIMRILSALSSFMGFITLLILLVAKYQKEINKRIEKFLNKKI